MIKAKKTQIKKTKWKKDYQLIMVFQLISQPQLKRFIKLSQKNFWVVQVNQI